MTAPRVCARCHAKPVATARHAHCYDCLPGGPCVPPPCRKCGSDRDYYTAGLCRRCHRFAPQVVDSCVDCLGWGVTRSTSWLCEGCRGWRRKISRGEGCCVTCGSRRHLSFEGLCRLCRRQAAMVHAIRKGATAAQANRHGQQLYLAGTFWGMRRPGRAAAAVRDAPRVLYPVAHQQLALFELPRDLPSGQRCGFPEPRDPAFAALLDRTARNHAARHGWSKTRTVEACSAIRILLGLQDTPGAPVKASDVARLAQIGIAVRPILDIIAEEGALEEDREPSISGWFARQITGLPEPMASELRVWFGVLLDGSTTPPEGVAVRWEPPGSTSTG